MLIDKASMPLVAMDFMNEVHAEDIDLINDLYDLILAYKKEQNDASKELLKLKYEEWYHHTVAHFANEEQAMQTNKFPPYLFHKGEHDQVLSTMNQRLNDWLLSGDIAPLQDFIEFLPSWLINHIQTMDTVTAMFLRTGFSPCSAR